MWFGFGLLTAALAFALGLRARLQARWQGINMPVRREVLRNHLQDDTTADAQPPRTYDYQVVRKKKKITARIGVAAPGLQFRIREEGKRDTFFKWLGISEELQTSDAQFDQRLYLETDAVALGNVLRERATLRTSILQIFDIARELDLHGCQLRCMSDRLWIEFRPADQRALETAHSRLVAPLIAIVCALRAGRLDAERAHDPFIWRAAALLAISTATAALGALGLARGLFGRTDILEPGRLFMTCIPLGLVFAGAFLLLIVVYLGRSSRTHVVLIEAALVGTFGFVTATFALAREANMEFDGSSPRRHELPDARAEHRITRGRRGRSHHHYYLHTADWRVGRATPLQITIDRALYEQLNGTTGAVIITRKGALGYEWIQEIAPPDTASQNPS